MYYNKINTTERPFANALANYVIKHKGYTPDMFDDDQVPEGFADALYETMNELFDFENSVIELIKNKPNK